MIYKGVKMKKIVNKISLIALSLMPTSVLAYTADEVEIKDPKTTDVAKIIGTIIDWVLLLVGGITVLFIIYAGVLYVTAAGNKDRIEKAKQTLTYAVIGLIVVILAGFIVSLTLGLPSNIGITK